MTLPPRDPARLTATIGAGILLVALSGCGVPAGGIDVGVPPPVPSTTEIPSTASTEVADELNATATPVFLDTTGRQPDGFVATDRAIRGEASQFNLIESPRDPMSGSFVPWAVPTADGATVYYTAWTQHRDLEDLEIGEVGGVPVIRRVDGAGVDSLFRPGAYAVAPALDGRVAYVEDLDGEYLFTSPNPNQIRVISADATQDEVWSTDKKARYVTVGWAGSTLLAYEVSEGEYVRTYAFDGPGEQRLLSDGGMIGAISPDGEWVLLVEKGDPGQGSQFVLVEPEDGRTLGPTRFATDLGPLNGTYQGDWSGDTIVMGPGAGNGVDTPYVFGYALLHFDGQQLTLDRFVALKGVEGMVSLEYPRFTPSGDVWIRLTRSVEGGDEFEYQDVVCGKDAQSCEPVSEWTPIDETAAIVDNKSGGA